MSSRNQVLTNNVNSFPNNNSGQITPQVLRDFNADFINSVVFLDQTSSMSVNSASYANNAGNASTANNATSASYALTASFALNAGGGGGTVNTGSLLSNATVSNADITFTRGNGTTFDITVNNVANANSASFASTAATAVSANTATSASFASNAANATNATSASFASTASFTPNAIITASVNVSTITFTKGNGSQFSVTVAQSGSVATASYAIFAESASNAANSTLLDGLDSTAFVLNSQTSSMSVLSASYAATASLALNSELLDGLDSTAFVTTSSYNVFTSSIQSQVNALQSATSSYATLGGNNNFVGVNNFSTITASNALITNLHTVTVTSSIIYNTGSNQLGDNANDTQTLWGTVDMKTGPVKITGSLNVSAGITGSLFGNASTATSASYAATAQQAASASYATNGGVTQLFAGPNITLSPLSGLGQVTISSTGTGVSYNTSTGSYGSFYDTGSYAIGSTTAVYSASLSSTDITNGVYISGSDRTKIFFNVAGVYNVQFSAQFTSSANDIANVNVWLRRGNDGGGSTDLDYTNGQLSVPGKVGAVNGSIIAGWNYFVTIGSNDYLQLMYQGEDTGVALTTISAGTTPTTPVSPALILTANRIDQFLSNTGSFSGSFTGEHVGNLTGTASFANNATSASYALSASFAQNAISASYAPDTTFPYTGSAGISGSLVLNGDAYLTGSLLIKPTTITGEIPFSIIEISDGTGFEGNIISARNTNSGTTGSIVISGSNNIVSLSNGGANSLVAGGTAYGFRGVNSIVTSIPFITGSLGAGYTRNYPTINNSVVNSTVNITDNRPAGTTNTSLTLSNVSLNGGYTSTLTSGSVAITNSNVIGTLTVNSTGSTGATRTISNSLLGTANITNDSNSGTVLTNNIINGVTVTLLLSGSTNGTLQNSLVVGNNLTVTGSNTTAANLGSAFVGRFNDLGDTALAANTAFAVGTGTGGAARRTSLHVSSSGLTTISNGLITGSLAGTASFATRATSASFADVSNTAIYANTAGTAGLATTASYAATASFVFLSQTSSLALTASFYGGSVTSASYASTASFVGNAGTLTQNLVLSGSVNGEVKPLTISSNTASMDCATANFFTLTLVSGSTTFLNPTNFTPGETVNLRVTQASALSGSLTFAGSVKQSFGNSYVPSKTGSAVDVLTFIAFDSTNLLMTNVNNLA